MNTIIPKEFLFPQQIFKINKSNVYCNYNIFVNSFSDITTFLFLNSRSNNVDRPSHNKVLYIEQKRFSSELRRDNLKI